MPNIRRLVMRMVEQTTTKRKVISQSWCGKLESGQQVSGHMSSLSEVGRRVRLSLVSRLTPAHSTTRRQRRMIITEVVMRWEYITSLWSCVRKVSSPDMMPSFICSCCSPGC